MWRNFPEPATLFVCYLPVFLVLGTAILLIVLPVARAPTSARITRYARKLVRDYPNTTDAQLRRILRTRFLPEWATDQPPEVSFLLFGLWAILIPIYFSMRSYLLVQVVDSRIRRAIEAVDSDWED